MRRVDQKWVGHLRGRAKVDLGTCDTFTVEGVELEMPLISPRGATLRHRDWQRRVIDDIVPDSAISDAPERMTFGIIDRMTTAQKTPHTMMEATTGEFEPLRPLFSITTRGRQTMPVAFHVLAAKSHPQAVKVRGFKDNTFRLLCRNERGFVDHELVAAFIERFRRPLEQLDLAQQAMLEGLSPNWTPEAPPTFAVTDAGRTRVFSKDAAIHFQRDLKTLLASPLPSAEFFHHANQLLALHFGLYQSRVATALNPAMDALFDELAEPDSQDTTRLQSIEDGSCPDHRFAGRYSCRAPDPDGARPVGRRSAARRAYEQLELDLGLVHFNLLLLQRLRDLTRAYLLQQGHFSDEEAIFARSSTPLPIVQRLQNDPKFREFLERATEALAARFIVNQIAEADQAWGWNQLEQAPTGLHALRRLYERFNAETGGRGKNRAYKHGVAVAGSLLNRGEYGVLQRRKGVGGYFELGVGMLPLLLLLVMGADTDRLRVDQFWAGLEAYGLSFDDDERERLLGRLKAMGLYERFSDAGEASYVRNLMVFDTSEVAR